MLRWRVNSGPQPLRTRLLVPIVLLLGIGTVGSLLLEEFSVRRQQDALVTQRGQTVLAGIVSRMQDRQRAKEIFAQLLADQPGLPQLIERRDTVGLAQILVPLKSKLGLGQIELYHSGGKPLLSLGSNEAEADEDLDAPLVRSALAGLTDSVVAVADEGLFVLGGTPVKGASGIVGALVVGRVLDSPALHELMERGTVEIAVYARDKLVGATVSRADLVAFLSSYAPTSHNVRDLERALAQFEYRPSIFAIQGGTLVALVPIGDLVASAHERQLIAVAVTVGLLALLTVVVVFVSRDIVRPLGAIVEAAKDIIRGNYGRRLPPSSIKELDGLTGAINHLTQQVEVQIERLAHQALHDPLSSLPNRTLFMDRLASALARAERRGNRVAAMFLDLDNFKVINDSLGHQAGDQLLVAVAERLSSTFRSEDTIARLGGDEFAILAEGIGSAEDLGIIAERVAQSLREPFSLQGRTLYVTTSVGVAISEPGATPGSLLRNADVAMYQAKNSGKARSAIYDPTMTVLPIERLQIELELRRALQQDEIKVYYQPIVDLHTGRIVQVEALARWEHPRLGIVPPDRFIPTAEETGLIIPLGRRVLEQAIRTARNWQPPSPDPPLIVSVNLSARQFQHHDLLSDIRHLLAETGLPPEALQLEITESVLMQSGLANVRLLKDLRRLGVGLAIDDFGTGYSSLAYIKQFPIGSLKIDRSFVGGLVADGEDAAIVQAIASLARALKLTTIAEGVETDQQRDLLREMGCNLAQGYLFARPMPLEALEELRVQGPHRPDAAETAAGAALI